MREFDVEFARAPDVDCAANDVCRWQVEFSDGPECEAFRQSQRELGMPLSETSIADYSGRPLLCLFQLRREPGHCGAVTGDSAQAADHQHSGDGGKKN